MGSESNDNSRNWQGGIQIQHKVPSKIRDSNSPAVAAHRKLERRDFAAAVKAKLDPRLHPVAFQMLDGRDGVDSQKKSCAASP